MTSAVGIPFPRTSSALQELEKARRIQSQWPKKCGCGRIWTLNPSDLAGCWNVLPLAYTRSDEFSTNEARHCICGSTIEVILKIHDLTKE